MAKNLYKTTVVFWSDFDPLAAGLTLAQLAEEADEGSSYCSDQQVVFVPNTDNDPDWDNTEFFDTPEWEV
jgi:hypothetical protein